MLLALIGGGWWFYQQQQTKPFRESAVPIYNSYKVLVDEGNKTLLNWAGRSYENLFREFGDIKQKNQDLKMKAAAMTPPTDAAKKYIRSYYQLSRHTMKQLLALLL